MCRRQRPNPNLETYIRPLARNSHFQTAPRLPSLFSLLIQYKITSSLSQQSAPSTAPYPPDQPLHVYSFQLLHILLTEISRSASPNTSITTSQFPASLPFAPSPEILLRSGRLHHHRHSLHTSRPLFKLVLFRLYHTKCVYAVPLQNFIPPFIPPFITKPKTAKKQGFYISLTKYKNIYCIGLL